MKFFLEREFRQHGPDGCALLIDVHGYYASIRHEITNQRFERKLPPSHYKRVRDVLDHQYSGETGYNPGSQMVQLAGISVPDPIDHYIKERLRADKYLRFMDDSIIVHHSKEQLHPAAICCYRSGTSPKENADRSPAGRLPVYGLYLSTDAAR